MKKDVLFTVPSYFRDDMNIMAYRFGKGEKSCAVVGALRGDEVEQLYVCARLVAYLRDVEKDGGIQPGKSVMVVPTAIGASMNVGSRLWAPENMDINRRFPGDMEGSTTERIAGALLERLKAYRYGVQLTSFYQAGSFVPHVRIMDAGRQNPEMGCEFGLPYVYVRTPRNYDHTTLNYCWQMCGTQAYSLYAGKTKEIDENAAEQTLRAIIRFLNGRGIIRSETVPAYPSNVITNEDMLSVRSTSAGLLRRVKFAGAHVRRGEQLAFIINPCDGSVREVLKTPVTGTLFFMQDGPFVCEHSPVFQVLSSQQP
ncbi:MAG TPA: succinylglutamate desuccinylase/aspartoacylase family protein [Candidatus Ventricola intestinavium]|nr:succinylglutamate desuccinylase/aspartoacylase family protein [Candidatus Ventricola intestinavium]